MQTWYARLDDVAPIAHRRGLDPKAALDASYAARTAADWRALRDRYGIDYAVVPDTVALPFPAVHRAPGWTVHALAETTGAPPDGSDGARGMEPESL